MKTMKIRVKYLAFMQAYSCVLEEYCKQKNKVSRKPMHATTPAI
jgi:hypothetical protein